MTLPTEITGRIYTDNDITGQVVRVIREARENLAIVSPYVENVPHVEQAIVEAKEYGATITAFVRKDGDVEGGNNGKTALEWFRLNDIEIVGVPHLHAKFYMNENEAVVTSMNLLKSSWLGSLELGIVVTGDAHRQLVEYLKTLRRVSGAPELPTKPSFFNKLRKPRAKAAQKKSTKKTTAAVAEGYCIRCGDPLSNAEAKAKKTLCRNDYLAWAEYKNEEYPEKFCTTCGKSRKTSFLYPQCRPCFDENPLNSN